MKRSPFRFVRLFAVCAVLPALVESADAPKTAEERNPWIFNVDFPGGTLEQLVKAVSASEGAVLNLIGEKTDLEVTLPPFSLRNADSESLANALNQLIGARGLTIIRAPGPNMPRSTHSPGNLPVYVVARRNVIDRPAFDSFQLAPFLEKQSIEDIVTAIRTLWELNPGNKPDALLLKFHPPTKLLLVSGTPEAIAVAGKVIATLSGPSTGALAEKKRLEAVAAEVDRRRQIREDAHKVTPENSPRPPDKR